MNTPPRQPLSALAKWTAGLALFIGVGAVFGGGMMLFGPDAFGMEPMLKDLQKLPLDQVFFQSFTWPGLFLLLVNGLPQLWAGVLLLRRQSSAAWWVMACGVLLAGWISIQWFIFTPNPLTTIYSLFAVAELVLGWQLHRRGLTRSPAQPSST